MDIVDFLPKYPNIYNTKYDVMNPYNEDFYEAIFRKKEFYELKLDKVEIFPKERGMLTKYQETVTRYMSSYTPYDRLLLVHSMGSGKTCSAIGAVEKIKSEDSRFDGAIILARGEGILDNFIMELAEKCTPGYYIPENYKTIKDVDEKIRKIKKKIKFYKLNTFMKFAKKVSKMSDGNIVDTYSNKIIIIDEVHNLRPQSEKDGTVETYTQFHRFLHLVKNCKVLFLSGTPMKDSPEEISSVANLMLPLDNQFPTGNDFLEEFMDEEDGVYKIKDKKHKVIKEKLRGKISFLREPESTIPKEFIGKKKFKGLKHFVVAPSEMSTFQTDSYTQAYEKDKGGKKGVYNDSRQASLFVFPDGSYGQEGFKKYIKTIQSKKNKDAPTISTYKMSDELVRELTGESKEETLENIKKHSSTYAQVIKEILETNGNCFIYSSLVQGSGGILFSLLLELFGFSRAKGGEKDRSPRYAILTNNTASFSMLRKITNRFNQKDNMKGDYIKVIIGSKAVSEGYSFSNVVLEAVITPHWNYSETAQALARGTRLGSHRDLMSIGEKPIVRIIQSVAMPQDNTRSIDLFLYKTSEDKDISIRNMMRLLMENAFDCALNYMRNYVDGVDNSRECDYSRCNYKCDGVNMAEITNVLHDDKLDYSTYQLYYSNPKTPLIRRRIESLFRENRKTDLTSIIKNLEKDFTEDEIRNALYVITEETESEEYDYRTFLRIYSRSPVKKIINELEELYKTSFKLSFSTIAEYLQEYTEFEILSALQRVINENLILNNKYGLPCYLREDKNVYFLVDSLAIRPDFYTEYYTEHPTIMVKKTFNDIMSLVYSLSLPNIIDRICKSTTEKELVESIKTLPLDIQEMFIEASLVASEKNIDKGKELQQRILEYFKSYIKKLDNGWVSTFLKESKNISRCLKSKGDFSDWKDCQSSVIKKLEEIEVARQQKLREDNPYGIMGKYNPENGAFCIVDFEKEKQAKEKITGKKDEAKDDKRVSYSGKVCGAGGWKLNELIAIVVTRLKIEPPKDFRKTDSIATMNERINEDEELKGLLSENPDRDELRRVLYWGTPKKENGSRNIKQICEAMRLWFKENNLLEVDNMCGVQGKRKISKEKQEKEGRKLGFRIETFVPSQNRDKVKGYSKDISKLMNECFNLEKYSIKEDDNTWLLVFSKKKIVASIMIDKDNKLWNVCVAKNYRQRGIAKDAIKFAVKYICDKKGSPPVLLVDNRSKDAKKLLKMYTSFGFEIVKTDENHTTMSYTCE